MSDDFKEALKNANSVTISKTHHPAEKNSGTVVKPFRGEDTERMAQAIKKLLKPDWNKWIRVAPEYVKNNPNAKVIIIVQQSKGFATVNSLRQVSLGQKYFVFREKPTPPKRSGGSPPPKAKDTKVYKEKGESEGLVKHPDRIQIDAPIQNETLRVGRNKELSYDNPEGPFTLHIKGLVSKSSTYQVDWYLSEDANTKQENPVHSVTYGEDIPWQDQIHGLEYGKYRIGVKTQNGISSNKTVTIKPEQIRIGELLYRPDKNIFYLIAVDQYNSFVSAAQEHDKPLKKLTQAYQSGEQAQIDQAKGELDKKLEPLVDAATDTSDLVELIGIRGKKSYFMEKKQVLPDWHEYGPLRGGEQSMELVNNKNSFNMKKLKEQFNPRKYEKSLSAEATYSWDLIEPHSDSFGNWAKSMNRTLAEILDNQDNLADDRKFDYTAQAQVMRYSYGTSLNRSYNLKEGEIDLSLESEASFALAEGKVTGNWYIPNAEGKEIIFTDVPTRGSRAGQIIECNIGSFRFKATAELSGFAGASLQASAGLTFGMEEGKPKVRGSVKKSDNEKENYVGIGGEAFAGIKGTGSLTGSGEWKNPEKGHDWVSLLELGVSATAAGGLSLKGDFCVDFHDGRFILMFSGQLVCVAGGGGEFICTVGVKHISDFIIYLFHELKNEDFHHVGVITNEAFDMYVAYSTYGLVTGEDLRDIYEKGYRTAYKIYQPVKNKLKEIQSYVKEQEALGELHQQHKKELNQRKIKEIREQIKIKEQRMRDAKALANRILSNKQQLACQPPETKGQLLYSLTPMSWKKSEETQEEAIITILKTAQSWNDYIEIVSHCSEGGVKIPLEQGEKRLRHILDGRDHDRFELLRLQLKRLNRQPQINTAAIIDNGVSLPA